jgi:hypothetical protein
MPHYIAKKVSLDGESKKIFLVFPFWNFVAAYCELSQSSSVPVVSGANIQKMASGLSVESNPRKEFLSSHSGII